MVVDEELFGAGAGAERHVVIQAMGATSDRRIFDGAQQKLLLCEVVYATGPQANERR